jgi:hypothetical protein
VRVCPSWKGPLGTRARVALVRVCRRPQMRERHTLTLALSHGERGHALTLSLMEWPRNA